MLNRSGQQAQQSREVLTVRHDPSCAGPSRITGLIDTTGFTLVELLITISILIVFAGIMIQSSDPTQQERLIGTAQVIASDLDYARTLAVGNNSKYIVSFEFQNDRYVLRHSGTNSVLDILPKTPFRSPDDPADRQIVRLSDLPGVGTGIELYDPASGDPEGGTQIVPGATTTQDVEFGPLGSTTNSATTVIWLTLGTRSSRRFVPITIAPVTGLVSIGQITTTSPAVTGP